MEHAINQITVRGELYRLPEYSHENHGKHFFRFYLSVSRLSGAQDILPIIVEETLLKQTEITEGSMVGITGQVRSHNYREGGVRRLLIFIFATEMEIQDGPAVNELYLEGPICKEPIYRRTPLGREICDVMLAVPRGFHRADYLPCIFWGRTAQALSQCHVRDRIRLEGRLQSRIYNKLTESGIEERTAYEISALNAQVLAEE